MTWGFIVTGPAKKDMAQLDRQAVVRVQGGVQRLLDALDASRHPIPGTKHLTGWKPPTWRLRVGDWRVFYRLDHPARRVTVLRVKHRGQAYTGPRP